MKNLMHWWTGVVEDRDDPQEMGRVRVRIFGIHNDDLDKIPIVDLPWAHTMMPCTSASISGVGFSPTGLVEGSWVVGFFADGENMQDPIVMGSIHGYPHEDNKQKRAFKDSEGVYPRWYNDSDVSYVAREGKWKDHRSYFARYKERITKIETAVKPTLSTLDIKAVEGQEETRAKWSEPEPRHGAPGEYPRVHTYESETGVVREVDDTVNGTRIVEYHPAGTWYEIFPDGDKMTKVSGNNYQITIYNDNILIRGNQNITVEGNSRFLVKGDYIQEVMGDYHLKVHGKRHTKITTNDFLEVIGNFNMNAAKDHLLRVGKGQKILVDGDKTESVGGKTQITGGKEANYIFLDTLSMFSNKKQSFSTNDTQQFLSKNGLDFGSNDNWILNAKADMTINVAGSFNINAGPTFKVLATKIELN